MSSDFEPEEDEPGSEETEYQVEGILEWRYSDGVDGGVEFRTKWKGWVEQTWEPYFHFVGSADEIIGDFMKEHGLRKRQVGADDFIIEPRTRHAPDQVLQAPNRRLVRKNSSSSVSGFSKSSGMFRSSGGIIGRTVSANRLDCEEASLTDLDSLGKIW